MPHPSRVRLLCIALALALLVLVLIHATGCTQKVAKAPPPTPAPAFTGPTFLQGTVGSLATVRGMEPMLVSGFGLVVDLPETGSTQVPAFLRQWLIQEMRRRGVGSMQTRNILPASPEQILSSGTAAVVAIEGFLPPGAVRGTRFDLLVSALPQTETTSLEGGRLWMADLSLNGTDPELRFSRRMAIGGGPMYLNPLEGRVASPGELHPERDRQAVVLSGGVVATDRKIELFLNQPSWTRSRMVADRINERFHHDKATQTFDTAVPLSDQVIQINVPKRYAHRPEVLLDLISHLYLQRGVDFEAKKAQELALLLTIEPKYATDVILAWESLGKMALPVVRKYYDHPKDHVRKAALEVGGSLRDATIVPYLEKLAGMSDPAMRQHAARLLVYLPDNVPASAMLKKLLDDDDRAVRIAAYQSVIRVGDPDLIQSTIMGEGSEFKFILDVIPAQKPLIYISQSPLPRIAVFGERVGFKSPTVAKLWNNRLMFRTAAEDKPVSVFYQPRGQIEGKTYTMAPTVANLAFLLAHKPDKANPSDGLDLTYSQVVNAFFALSKAGDIPAPLEVQISPLAQAIAKARQAPATGLRPETVAPAQSQPATAPAARPETDGPAPPTPITPSPAGPSVVD